jgi:hypothetical protein
MRRQPAMTATADAGGRRYQWHCWSFTVAAAHIHALGRLRAAWEGVVGQQEEHNHSYNKQSTEPRQHHLSTYFSVWHENDQSDEWDDHPDPMLMTLFIIWFI